MELWSAGRHPTITKHGADEIPLSRVTLGPKVGSGQRDRDSVTGNQSIGSLPFP